MFKKEMKTLNEYIKESLLDDFDDLENELNTILAIKDTIGYKYDVEYDECSHFCVFIKCADGL